MSGDRYYPNKEKFYELNVIGGELYNVFCAPC